MKINNLVIAIDGTAASGKGTLGKKLAESYKIPYLDTGNLYRSVASLMLSENVDLNDQGIAIRIAKSLDLKTVNVFNNRNIEVTNASSIIAQFEGVRNVLLDFQREFAKDGAVVDGRDIGTIVLPNADQKFYITASLEVRAKRRFEQYKENNEKIDLKTIKYDIEARDKRDKERSIAPLKIADDAIIIDTSNLCIKSVFDFAAGHINNNLNTNKYKV